MFLKRVKKCIALALIGISTIIPMSNTVSAMNMNQGTSIVMNKEADTKVITELAEKYNFEVSMHSEQSDTEYIVVNSEEELTQVLSSLNNFVDELESENNELILESNSHKATQEAKFYKGLGLTIGNWSSAKFNVFSSLEVSNKKITKVNYSDQSLTGFTLGISLTKGKTNCSVSSDRTKATVRGTGTVNVNILFEGIGTVFQRDYTVSGTYTAK